MPQQQEMVDSVGGAVGRTPLVALNRLCKPLTSRIAIKLEFFNPGASLKDRVAWRILEEAEEQGALQKGQPVIELTSGNMGAGLAWACAVKGYRFVAVMSRGNTPERRQMIKAFGAKVELVDQVPGGQPGEVSKEDLEKVEKRTQEMVAEVGAFRPDQFNHPGSVHAHEFGTGPEIWEQTQGKVTHFCSLVGSSGTLMGTSKALKERNPDIKTYAVEPASAQFLAGKPIESTRHKLQGGGYALQPGIYDTALVDETIAVTDREAQAAAVKLAAKEGIMGGYSTGANLAAALKLATQNGPDALIVTVACDSGLKYLSTDLYQA